MNPLLPILSATSLLFSSTLLANDSFIDYGRVLSVVPIYKSTQVYYPHRECRVEHSHGTHHNSRASERNNNSGTLVGAVVGGVLGHQIGHGRSRDLATVAGSVIGAAIGAHGHTSSDRRGKHRSKRHNHRHTGERCETVESSHRRRKLIGFDVTYRYKGEIFYTRTEHDPGKRLRLSVNITPLD